MPVFQEVNLISPNSELAGLKLSLLSYKEDFYYWKVFEIAMYFITYKDRKEVSLGVMKLFSLCSSLSVKYYVNDSQGCKTLSKIR